MSLTATLGNVVRIGPAAAPILVKDSTGALIDPATITVAWVRPDNTTTAPVTPVRDSLGTYHSDYEPALLRTMAGPHRYRIVTTSPDAAFEDQVFFLPSPFAS